MTKFPSLFRVNLLSVGFVFVGILGLASVAHGSPWLLKPGQLVVSTGYDQVFAKSEFVEGDNAKEIPFSLRGLLTTSTLSIGARMGIIDGFELELKVPLKVVNYVADPVILVPEPEGGTEGIDYYQRNVIELGRSVSGLGDIGLAGRFALSRSHVATALELELTMPSGYEGPSGTFGDNPTDTEDFIENAGQYVRPQNIKDDVTLGDGVLAFTPRLLLGKGFRTGTFFRTSAGVALRTNGASHQLQLTGKLGQRLARWLVVWGGAKADLNLTRGRVIGVSVGAEDPGLAASDYGGLTNLKLRTPRLEYQQVMPSVGAILRISRVSDINFSYSQVVWGSNVAASRIVSIGLAVRADLLLKKRK